MIYFFFKKGLGPVSDAFIKVFDITKNVKVHELIKAVILILFKVKNKKFINAFEYIINNKKNQTVFYGQNTQRSKYLFQDLLNPCNLISFWNELINFNNKLLLKLKDIQLLYVKHDKNNTNASFNIKDVIKICDFLLPLLTSNTDDLNDCSRKIQELVHTNSAKIENIICYHIKIFNNIRPGKIYGDVLDLNSVSMVLKQSFKDCKSIMDLVREIIPVAPSEHFFNDMNNNNNNNYRFYNRNNSSFKNHNNFNNNNNNNKYNNNNFLKNIKSMVSNSLNYNKHKNNRINQRKWNAFCNNRGVKNSIQTSSNGKKFCRLYNMGSDCSGCNYDHLCIGCKGTHPLKNCSTFVFTSNNNSNNNNNNNNNSDNNNGTNSNSR